VKKTCSFYFLSRTDTRDDWSFLNTCIDKCVTSGSSCVVVLLTASFRKAGVIPPVTDDVKKTIHSGIFLKQHKENLLIETAIEKNPGGYSFENSQSELELVSQKILSVILQFNSTYFNK